MTAQFARVGTPKSKRSFRSVPLASRVATELELLSQESRWKGDDDLVFAHPHGGQQRFTHANDSPGSPSSGSYRILVSLDSGIAFD